MPNTSETGDAAFGTLLDRARSGDARAREELAGRLIPFVHAAVRLRMDKALRAREGVSDVVNSVVGDLLTRLQDFRFGRREDEFRRWAATAVMRKLLMRKRHLLAGKRDARRDAAPGRAGDGEDFEDLLASYAASGLPTPSQVASARESVERFEAAFDRLPEDYRQVILLARVEKLPHQEIAARMGRTESATRNLLARAIAMLTRMDGIEADP